MIKKSGPERFLLVFAGAILMGIFGSVAQPAVWAGVEDFTIRSFEADYYLGRESDGTATLKVVETIKADFPSVDQNHGILRSLPESYQNHSVNLKVESVSDGAGNKLSYGTESSNGNKVLKIGDPEKYVRGQQTYTIAYTMQNVISKPDNAEQDEFYWDTNGTKWPQAVQSLTARVHIPADIAAALQPARSCYTGGAGSSAHNCTISITPGAAETVMVFTATQALGAYENLTMATAFTKDTFAAYKPSMSEILWQLLVPVLTVLPPVIAGSIVVRNWLRRGRDPKGRGVIVPQYIPPKGVTVMGASAILSEKFRPQSVSAQIIDLAVRHYLKVYETSEKKLFGKKSTYELELIKDVARLSYEEQTIAHMLFGSNAKTGSRVALDSLNEKLYAQAARLGKKVNQEMAAAGYFVGNPDRARVPYFAAGAILLFVGFFTVAITIGIGLIIAGAIAFIGAAIIPARSRKGVELREYLFGLRDYMQLAEADRLKVLQSPHGELTEKVDAGDSRQLVKLYEKLLPYAVLFGIEKEWAKTLAPLYEQSPEWYSGSGGFQPVLFVAALSSFNTATTQSFSPPSSSSSSGAGGGGFSGGGGGGGGGGGW